MPDPTSTAPPPGRLRHARHFAFGLLMGGADIIPGVSGGTMALIVGVYEALVASIGALFTAVLAAVRFDIEEAQQQVRRVAWGLVLPLGLGIATAILIGARVIPYFLETYPVQCRGLFFGLIAGSLALPWLRMERRGAEAVGIAAAGAVAAFLLTGLPPATVATPTLPQVLGAASVAICAMILPGVSGAFLLLVMGMYEPTLGAIRDRDLLYIGTFALGAGLGLGLFAKLLTWLLRRYHDRTMAALVGLMVGSLRALWPWQTEARTLLWPTETDPVLSVVLLGLAGFLLVSALTWWGLVQGEG